MTIEIIIFFCLIYGVVFSFLVYENKVIDNVNILILSLSLSSIFFFKNKLTSDSLAYSNILEQIYYLENFDFIQFEYLFFVNGGIVGEYIFKFIFYFLSRVTNDFFEFSFLYSLLTLFLLFKCFKKISNEYLVIILLFSSTLTFYFFFGNVIRQAGTLPFFILCVYFLKIKEMNKYCICILLGTLVHSSFCVFLVLPFLVEIRNKNLFLVFFLVFLVSYFGIVNYIVNSIAIIPILVKLASYLDSESVNHISFNSFSFVLVLLVIYLCKTKIKNDEVDFYLNFYLGINIIQYAFFNNFIVFTRIGMYKSLLEVVIFVIVITTITKNKIASRLLIILFSLFYFLLFTYPVILDSNMFLESS